MRKPLPARTLAAATALAASLALALAPGTAAAEDDRYDCVATPGLLLRSVSYTCETESEDLRWRVVGLCTLPWGFTGASSDIVQGSGTAVMTCPSNVLGGSAVRSHQLSVLS
ncbi:hypothetical protein [Nocardiopsis ganjiahuensis]|uniref:hypothetical protein n=1 Tax=Nocardiopsis ganjiahuensis TaxID=239984 RepID=UPI00034D5D84|nr:hypothetical protein [Nocardiopsis ganjiahuensis]